jgi:hypothetical protein
MAWHQPKEKSQLTVQEPENVTQFNYPRNILKKEGSKTGALEEATQTAATLANL